MLKEQQVLCKSTPLVPEDQWPQVQILPVGGPWVASRGWPETRPPRTDETHGHLVGHRGPLNGEIGQVAHAAEGCLTKHASSGQRLSSDRVVAMLQKTLEPLLVASRVLGQEPGEDGLQH